MSERKSLIYIRFLFNLLMHTKIKRVFIIILSLNYIYSFVNKIILSEYDFSISNNNMIPSRLLIIIKRDNARILKRNFKKLMSKASHVFRN